MGSPVPACTVVFADTLYCCVLLLQLKAQAQQIAQMSATQVKGALDAGLAAWASYDKNGVSVLHCVWLVELMLDGWTAWRF